MQGIIVFSERTCNWIVLSHALFIQKYTGWRKVERREVRFTCVTEAVKLMIKITHNNKWAKERSGHTFLLFNHFPHFFVMFFYDKDFNKFTYCETEHSLTSSRSLLSSPASIVARSSAQEVRECEQGGNEMRRGDGCSRPDIQLIKILSPLWYEGYH